MSVAVLYSCQKSSVSDLHLFSHPQSSDSQTDLFNITSLKPPETEIPENVRYDMTVPELLETSAQYTESISAYQGLPSLWTQVISETILRVR